MAYQEQLQTAQMLLARGNVEYDVGRRDAAAYAYSAALDVVQELLDDYLPAPAPEALVRLGLRLHHNLGMVLSEQEDRHTAVSHFERALELAAALDPASPEIGVRHHNLAVVYDELGKPAQALKHYRAALEILDVQAPVSRERANTLGSVGRLSLELGERESGVEYLDAFAELAAVAYPTAEEAADHLMKVGGVLQAHGELDRALDCYEKAAAIAETAHGASAAVAYTLNAMGTAVFEQGRLEHAWRLFERALTTLASIDPASMDTAGVHNNLGLVAKTRGQLERALRHYRYALRIAEADAPGSYEEATALNNIGSVLRAAGDLVAASEYYGRSLAVLQETAPQSPLLAGSLNNIGFVQLASGDLEAALGNLLEALAILETLRPRSKQTARCLHNIGAVHQDRADLGQALAHYRRALDIDAAIAPRSPEVAYRHARIGSVLRTLGDLQRAISHYEQAVAIAEVVRVEAGRAKEWILSRHTTAFAGLIACLYARGAAGDHEQAFNVAERSRARVLVELLAERQVDVRPVNERQASLLEEERTIRFRLAATYNQLSVLREKDRSGAAVSRLASEEHELEEALDRLSAEIRDAFPQYAELLYPEPLTLPEAQRLLPSDVLLLSYTIAGDESFLFVVRHDQSRMVSLGVGGDRLEELLNAAVGAYRRGEEACDDAAGAWVELSRLLIGPIPPELLAAVTRVVVIPDEALFYLPFEPLPLTDGGLFGERFITCYAPSATVMGNLGSPEAEPAAGGLVGFGDPVFSSHVADENGTASGELRPGSRAFAQLPGTRRELERIAAMFGDRDSAVYFGAEATEHRVKSASAGYRIVHLATHGVIDDTNPLYSGVVLSSPAPGEPEEGDDFLQTYEMFGLPLSGAEMVVLSACQTGLGRIQAGEGLVGMTRALFFAGARCVVVSLWPVPDLPTARLMVRFYEHVARGMPPALALKEAKESVRKTHPTVYRDPRSWAAFVVVGLGW